MEIPAALLLTILLAVFTVNCNGTTTALPRNEESSTEFVRTTTASPEKTDTTPRVTTEHVETTSKSKFIHYPQPFTNVKDLLLQEILTLDKDNSDAMVSVYLPSPHSLPRLVLYNSNSATVCNKNQIYSLSRARKTQFRFRTVVRNVTQ